MGYCVPNSLESVSRSYGENLQTQNWWAAQYSSYMGENFDGVYWDKMAKVVRLNGYNTRVVFSSDEIAGQLKGGRRVLVGTETYSFKDADGIYRTGSHMMVYKSMKLRPSGKFELRLMDPNGGIFRTYNAGQLRALNPTYIYIGK